MWNLFDDADRDDILARLARLEAASPRQWGKMNVAQMLTHCSRALEAAIGDRPTKQKLIGKLLGPFFRSTLLGDRPLSHDSPTDPSFVVTDERDFATEKERLTALVGRFFQRGPDEAARQTHAFLGAMTGQEWGRMQYKHLDHHLRQFGA